ncbi:MAG: hypothetical protein WBW04_12430 [Nitrolancea sp.]
MFLVVAILLKCLNGSSEEFDTLIEFVERVDSELVKLFLEFLEPVKLGQE